MVRLGDVCEVVSGSTPKTTVKEYWDGNFKWITPAELKSDSYVVYDTERHVTELAIKETGLKSFPEGTVLLSSRAPIGKVAIAGCEMYCNQGFKNLICSKQIDSRYLYNFLSSKTELLNSLGRGATFKELSKSIVEDIEIPLPTLGKQVEIAQIFESLDELIEKRKQQLQKLDELVKARFVEIFGDAFTNDKGWDVSSLGEYMTLLTDFSANGSYELLDSNVVMYDEPNYAIMVRTTDLEANDFSNNVKYIDENAYELLSKSKLYGGELIMNKIGSAGRIYLMPYLNCPASLGRNAFMFRFDNRINVTYLYMLLTSEYGTKEIQQYVRGAVTKTITKDSVRAIKIIVPPIKLQNEFATFVQQIDKSKLSVQKSLEKLEVLKKALMQKYFG